MIMSESEARDIARRTLAKVRLDSATVSISSSEESNIRFARNAATTNGARGLVSVEVGVNVGKRTGSSTTTQIDEAGLKAAVEQAERIARLSPENSEFLPPLGQQSYGVADGYSEAAARDGARRMADMLEPVVRTARARDVTAAGYMEGGASASAFATSAGLFVYHRQTGFDFTVSARTPDGSASGWAGASAVDLAEVDGERLMGIAIDKAVRGREPATLDPGRYTVLLEPSPVADMLGYLGWSMDARSADEGRSAFSKKGGGNRIGDQILGPMVNIRSDPADKRVPGSIYGEDGLPQRRTTWFENGVLRALPTSRYWASRTNTQPLPWASNMILEGGTASMEDLIGGVERGVLVTRFWYIRFVDPRSLLLTGLTRDGMFLIENGQVTRPVRNMRWNESPLAVFSNVEALGVPVRARGTEAGGAYVAPAIVARNFTFSSVSEAV